MSLSTENNAPPHGSIEILHQEYCDEEDKNTRKLLHQETQLQVNKTQVS